MFVPALMQKPLQCCQCIDDWFQIGLVISYLLMSTRMSSHVILGQPARIRLDRLELRPVATPARCQSAPGSIGLNQQRGSEVTPSESHSNIMLLKVMLPGRIALQFFAVLCS